jgi:hypothetical protein
MGTFLNRASKAVLLAAALVATQAAPTAAIAQTPTVEVGNLSFGALPAQRLANAECKLFLWSRTPSPQLIFIADSRSASARVDLNRRTLRMERTALEGEEAFGFQERQTYAARDVQITAALTFRPDAGLTDGMLVDASTLSVRLGDGEQTVVPVGGLIACGTPDTGPRR